MAMIVERKSRLTGKLSSRVLDVTHEEIVRWQAGELIQYAMPRLSPADREFIMTGITEEEWALLGGDE